MTRRVLAGLLIALALIGGGGLSARADVTGTTSLNIGFKPIPCTVVPEIKLNTPCEATIFKFDVESISIINVTISGLLFAIDSALGVTGLEHIVLKTRGTFGVVELIDEFWFATPFQTVTDVNLLPNVVTIPPARFMFVKKRVTGILDIGGINLSALAMFEDVSFPNPGAPYGATDCDGDGIPDGTCVDGVATNPANQYQTQSFRFGGIITLQGQTISGITITSTTGICADQGANTIKKFSAAGRACTDRKLLFSFEQISLGGLVLAKGIILSQNFIFRPSAIGVSPFLATTSVTFPPLLGFVTLGASFSTALPFVLTGGPSLSINAGAGDLGLILSFNNTLNFSGASFSLRTVLNPGQNEAIFSSNAGLTAGVGITSLSLGLSVTRGIFSSSHSVAFAHVLTPGVTFVSYAVSLNLSLPPAIFSIGAVFGQAGLAGANITAGLSF